MGRAYDMVWEGQPNYRWVKCYRNQRYRVTCEQLGTPRSKEDSYKQANQWWRLKKAELDNRAVPPEYEVALRDIDRKIKYAKAFAPDLEAGLQSARGAILASPPGDSPLPDEEEIERKIKLAELFGIRVPDGCDPMVLQEIFGDRRLWQERFVRAGLVEHQKTLGVCLEEFLNEARLKQKPATYKEMERYLRGLTEKSGLWTSLTDVTTISEQTVRDHYKWLKSRSYSAGTHNKRLGFFRRFVSWLWREKKIEQKPRNLEHDDHREELEHREVTRFSKVKEVVNALPRELRLWALLGLNCGMTNADLGSLDWGQIDCVQSVLTRRRVKTGDARTTPTVAYKLWPQTIALLRSRRNKNGLVFTTAKGKPMYETRFNEDNKVVCKDNFGLRWKRNKPKSPIPLGKFRSISASTLRKDPLYRQYEDYFLGHAPKTVADKHYAGEDDEAFFKALEFIRRDIFGPRKGTTRKQKTK